MIHLERNSQIETESLSEIILIDYNSYLTVADENGVIYYSQDRLMKLLKLDNQQLLYARDELTHHNLIS